MEFIMFTGKYGVLAESAGRAHSVEFETAMKGILYGVGVGPGDPELLTAKAIRLLRECDAVAAPKSADGRQTALDIASPYIGQDKTILLFDMPMTHDRQA